jgi:hypothetical protein
MRSFPAVALAVFAVLAPSTALAATHAKSTKTPSKQSVVQPLRKVPLGISEQNATMFTDPLFAPLGVKYARYVTPWNVALTPGSYAAQQLDKWITGARTAGVSALVSFEHLGTENCPHDPCVLPSKADYRAAIVAFHALYPDVTALSPWNEANHPSQPTVKKPKVAAQYYKIVKSVCPTCQVVAADVLDMTNMEKWLTAFVKAAPEARLWGMHNYGDANRFRTSGLATYLKVTKGSVWLTETGAITSFTTTSGVVSFAKSDTRAAKAMNYLLGTLIPSSSRIKRVYIYNWGSDPANRWDSGLLDNGGRPRQIYSILKTYNTPLPGTTTTPTPSTGATPVVSGGVTVTTPVVSGTVTTKTRG